jgi:hypothetical protein
MSYWNPVLQFGVDAFADALVAALAQGGVSGLARTANALAEGTRLN